MGGGKGWDRQIARRLIVWIVLVSGLLASLATAAQLWIEYDRDVARIRSGFPQIEASYLGSVVQNVWLVDRERLGLLLDGIIQMPDFTHAVVLDEDGTALAEAGTRAEGDDVLSQAWPLWFKHRDVPLYIGRLQVTADLDSVYGRLWQRVGVILTTNMIKTALVALVILIVVRRLVTRPLEEMAAYARRLTPERLDEPLVLDRPGQGQGTDELDYLAASLNAMREDLRASYGRLRASEVRFRGLFANTPVSLWEVDLGDVKAALDALPCRSVVELESTLISQPETASTLLGTVRIQAVNQATLDLFGASSRSHLVRHLDDILAAGAAERAVRDLLCSLWLGRMAGGGEAEVQTLDRGPRHVFARWSLLPGAEGSFGRAIISLIDVSESELAREELQKTISELARSNSELERFAYVASHDLREPLRTIVSYSQLLERKAADTLDAESREFLGYVTEGAHRLDALVGDLLSYARINQRLAPFAEMDLAAVVDAVVDQLGAAVREAGAEITVEPLPRVVGNRIQIMEVFQHLLTNALKFRRPGTPPRIRISCSDEAERWVIHLRDNGEGIAPAHHATVFQVFRRLHGPTHHGGTGMGLAVCRRILRHHGGDIWVESELGTGATFSFSLPKVQEDQDGAAPAPAAERVDAPAI